MCRWPAAAALVLAASCGDGGGDPVTDRCGDLRTSLAPIVNGVESHDPEVVDLTEGNVAAVGALLASFPDGTVQCTATLVGPHAVLTSAHCVPGSTTAIEFRVGPDFLDPEASFEATEWHRHPLYDDAGGGAPDHDLAVAIIDGDTAAAGIEPILVSDAYTSILGREVQAVGYGATGDPGGNSRRWWTVQEVQLEFPFSYSIGDGGLSGLCSGDSGGPLLATLPEAGVRVMGTASSISDPDCLGASNYSRTDTSLDWLAPLVPTGPCGLETRQGRCDGDVAVWCESDEVVREDCAALGMQCGPGDGGRMRCVPPCEGETWQGRCDGDVAVWCESDEVVREDCAEADLDCGEDAGGLHRCVDVCTALGETGACDGDLARWCEDGELKVRDCGLCDQVCTMLGDPPLAYCE
jgi:hypothetical protein